MSKLAIVAGLSALYSTACIAQASLSTSCIGNRCAVYSNGRRVGSYEDRGFNRVTVRDREGRMLATVEDRGNGRARVTPARPRR